MDERSTRVARRLEPVLLIAALLTIPATIIQESHHVGAPWPEIARYLNWLIWAAFVADAAIMLWIVPRRRDWLRAHPLDIAIIILTFPAELTAVQPIRLLRLLRLLRLAPAFKLLMTREGLRYAIALALLTAVGGGAAFASVERYSIGNGIYWAVTTMTTVGYGDIVPHTPAGKVVAVIVMLIGIGVATLVIGAVAQRFVAQSVEEVIAEVDAEEVDTLVLVREITDRLSHLEAAIERSNRGGAGGSTP